jgi:cytochrome c-type biogenesis protein CcmH/NrfF
VTRWFGVVGLGLLAALVAIMLLRPSPAMTGAERADALAAGLRCPDCQGLSVADSHTPSAQEIRRQIGDLVARGATDDEVRDHFVARYGSWVLLAPAAAALWLIPLVLVVVAATALGAWLVMRRRRGVDPSPAITEEERRRIHDEAEALDA